MIFIIIGIVVLYVGYRDFRLGFFTFLTYKLFLNQNISLIDIPGMPLLTLDMFMTIAYLYMYYKKRKFLEGMGNVCKVPFPLYGVCVLLVCSWGVSSVFSLVGFVGSISSLMRQITNEVLIVWLIWKCVNSQEDYRILIKLFTFVFLFATLYMFFEKSIQYNPIINYEVSLMKNSEKALSYIYDIGSARGYRASSIFFHCIGAGMNFVLYFLLVFFSLFLLKRDIPLKNVTIITATLCIPCIFMTSSRSPIVFFLISLLGVVNFSNYKFWLYSLVGLIILFFVLPYFHQYDEIIASIFSDKAQDNVGGSNADMREEQFLAAWTIMSQNPLLGLGFKYETILNSVYISELLGRESVWFWVLPQFGLFGAISYLIYAFFCIYTIPHHYHSRSAMFLSLAYWITTTITSVPGFCLCLYYFVYFYIIKNTAVFVKESSINNYTLSNGKKQDTLSFRFF